MVLNYASQVRPDMLADSISAKASVAQPAQNMMYKDSVLANKNLGSYLSVGNNGAAGAQGPTPPPANPFAGANNPTPTNPTPPPQAAPVAPTQRPVFRQPITPQGPRQLGGYGFQNMPQQQMPPAQSMTQQVGGQAGGRGGAQSVSNYMQALRQSGAGSANAMMNAQGQRGAGPQAGFMGFGQNGIQTQLGGRFVGPQQMNTGLQFQQNMANTNQNYFAGNQASTRGLQQAYAPELEQQGGISTVNGPSLLGGAQNAPQYVQPGPWINQANRPQNSQQWEDYFYGKYDPWDNPNQQPQQGAMYTADFNDPRRPPPTQAEIDQANAELAKYNDPDYNSGIGPDWSDERLKENINPAEDQLTDFMNNLGVYSYEYKPEVKNLEGAGHGRYVSPMAQEFEKSEIGRSAVITDPKSGYKKVDYGRLMGVQTAALALLNHKYNKLEKQFKESIGSNIKSKRAK